MTDVAPEVLERIEIAGDLAELIEMYKSDLDRKAVYPKTRDLWLSILRGRDQLLVAEVLLIVAAGMLRAEQDYQPVRPPRSGPLNPRLKPVRPTPVQRYLAGLRADLEVLGPRK